jgi:hypothetical protein
MWQCESQLSDGNATFGFVGFTTGGGQVAMSVSESLCATVMIVSCGGD